LCFLSRDQPKLILRDYYETTRKKMVSYLCHILWSNQNIFVAYHASFWSNQNLRGSAFKLELFKL